MIDKLCCYSRIFGLCLTCVAAKKSLCSSSGHWIGQADEIMKDATLKLKEELLKMKEQKTEKVTKAVENRRKVQLKLSAIWNPSKLPRNESNSFKMKTVFVSMKCSRF